MLVSGGAAPTSPCKTQWAVPDHGAMLTFPPAERGRLAPVPADFKERHGIEVVDYFLRSPERGAVTDHGTTQ